METNDLHRMTGTPSYSLHQNMSIRITDVAPTTASQRAAIVRAALLASNQYDDGLATMYNVDLGASPRHIQYNGIRMRMRMNQKTEPPIKEKIIRRVDILSKDKSSILFERAQKFDENGNLITSWGARGAGPSQFNNPTGMKVQYEGLMYG